MAAFSKDQIASREKTLLTAFLLSAPGPLVTGIAVMSSHSATQLADFIRRTVELAALFISWWIFRKIHHDSTPGEANQAKLERAAGLSVAGAMVVSGIALLIVSLSRLSIVETGGNVTFGLSIAVLGLLTNGWFWWRYTVMTREQYSSIIATQQKLYRAKASVDLCVVMALAAVAVAPALPMTRLIDILGSIVVSAYLVWNGFQLARSHLARNWDPFISKTTRSLRAYKMPVQKDND